MIEELNTSLKSKIQREVFKQTADVRKSVFQDDKDYQPGGAGANKGDMDKMVDKQEFKATMHKT
jgi:hypothetical protein